MQLQLETIINALDDAVLVLDEARQILFLNPAAARLFDCEGQKVLGQPLARFPEMAAILDQLKLSEMHLSADSPKGVRRLEGKKSAGDAFSLEALVTCVTADGRKFYIVDIRDISLQQQME